MSRALSLETPAQQTHFLLKWVLANTAGGFLIGLLENNGLQFTATLTLTGAILGSLQWSILSPSLRWRRWWPLASAMGWLVGSLIIASSYRLYGPLAQTLWRQMGLWEVFWLNLLTGSIAGLLMAIAQGWILARQGRAVPLWWAAGLLGGAAQGGVSAALCAAACPVLPSLVVGVVNAGGWAIYGGLTGLVLLVLLQDPAEVEGTG
ncbi:MAG TPA: hypothetical protein V6D06_01680 [Trichocoleus sp.]